MPEVKKEYTTTIKLDNKETEILVYALRLALDSRTLDLKSSLTEQQSNFIDSLKRKLEA